MSFFHVHSVQKPLTTTAERDYKSCGERRPSARRNCSLLDAAGGSMIDHVFAARRKVNFLFEVEIVTLQKWEAGVIITFIQFIK